MADNYIEELVALGVSKKYIAFHTGLSDKTIYNHSMVIENTELKKIEQLGYRKLIELVKSGKL